MNFMNKKIILLLVLIVVVGAGYFIFANMGGSPDLMMGNEEHEDEAVMPYEIYPGDVVEKIKNKEDIILLDVRTPEEYAEIHLKDALLLPVQTLSAQSLSEIGLGENAKNKEIIIYGRSGSRSKTAYDIMESLGYTNIKSIAGGMIHWQEDNYPFSESGAYTGPNTTTKDTQNVADGGPRITLDRKFHDFGLIPQYGGTVTQKFNLTNTGDKTLTIGTISTSCSCTSASISKKSIEPNGSAIVTVVFDPNFHEEPTGIFKRTVFIPTNDPTTPEAEITVQVDIAEGK